MSKDEIVVLGLSGRGDKDMGTVTDVLAVELP
jgi:tryptophan synthase beta subunit